MINIKIICVGKLKERFYADASAEYLKRLSSYAKTEIIELAEARRSSDPSPKEIEVAMLKEAAAIAERIPAGALTVAMCVEGKQYSSEELAELLEKAATAGQSKICFIIGGSDGLHPTIKAKAAIKMSMSRMTFPHHLARVMLLEQVYRGFKICEGSRYHK